MRVFINAIVLIILTVQGCRKAGDEIVGKWTWSYSRRVDDFNFTDLELPNKRQNNYELIIKKSGKGILMNNGVVVRKIPADSMKYQIVNGKLYTSVVPYYSEFSPFKNCFYKDYLDCSSRDNLLGTYVGLHRTNSYREGGFPNPGGNDYFPNDTIFEDTAVIRTAEVEGCCLVVLQFRNLESIRTLNMTEDNLDLNAEDMCALRIKMKSDSLHIWSEYFCTMSEHLPYYFYFNSRKIN